MKHITILLLLASLKIIAQAQEKSDYVWVLGYTPNNPEQYSGGTMIDFHTDPPSITYFNIPSFLTGIGLISNQQGDLLFYSNGCSVFNAAHALMANGSEINAGVIADYYCSQNGLGYPTSIGIMAIPLPGDTSNYVLLHFWADFSTLNKRLQYSKIDITQSNGLGAVTQKNEIAFQDTFTNHLTAVRHGNGRDWWIAAHKGRSNRSLLFLLDPDGIHAPIAQHIGPVWGPRDWSGQSVFSPDGSKYARANPDHGLNLFDFDRCTGALSNPVVVSLAADSASATGVAFSPNSRYLYLSTGLKLFQFDMQAPNIPASKQLIGVYDGFAAPFATTFYQMRLAPNGKIYMSTTNGNRYLHTIHQPDMPGAACNFVQHDLETPSHFYWALPNFPYFRLYDEQGSPCDTLGINGGPWWTSAGEAARGQAQVLLWPNPTDGRLQLFLPGIEAEQEVRLRVADISGRMVLASDLVTTDGNLALDASRLAPGVYFCLVSTAGQTFQPVKFVIAR